ncbi:MAG: hypothetical protein GX633_09680 [Clostridiales bacterium]|jgi:N-acylglucosamine 2-epimerase|nr:hypothetical protein [Clostridiales bacterium]
MDFKGYLKLYSDTLTNEVVPYWLRYSLDESGAINNCLSENGTVLSRDRYIWSQGRALWTFSALYNRIEQKQEYLDVAHGLFNYLYNLGPDESGKWNYLYDGDGNLLEKDISIYVDGFVLAGLTEYYIATGNVNARELALQTYENTLSRIRRPGTYRVAPYVIPDGMITHGVYMIFSFFYHCLGVALDRNDICDVAHSLAMDVLEKFYVAEKDAILEFVNIDGTFSDTPEGRACVPGHAIECMWFLINIFEHHGEKDNIDQCCRIIRRHLELAWDEKKGGLILALDIDGKEPVFWQKSTYKPWWVQSEALVATMYAYRHTEDEWFLDMHEKVSKYAFEHYPNGFGDWYNWLDNDGNIGQSAALPVKDPFHLPRALIYLIKLFSCMQ